MTFLTPKILEERESKYNGKITVKRMLGLGIYIEAGGLTQSGGIVKSIWQNTFKRIVKKKKKIERCLILGLGAGSVAEVISKNYPDTLITGVDIDPAMINIGKKYFDLSEVSIKIMDAVDYIKKCRLSFDLIVVDLYHGDKFPKKLEEKEILLKIKKLLNKNGVVVFNRLYFGEKRKESLVFAGKLEKIFNKVCYYYPEANIMLICS